MKERRIVCISSSSNSIIFPKMPRKDKANNDKIPRPMNCFLAYRLEKQREIVALCPGANHRDISKIIAKWWKEASEEEKAPYRERARLAKLEHAKRYPDYKYKPQKRTQKTRKYVSRPKDQFTSRSEDNNRCMQLLYNSNPNDLLIQQPQLQHPSPPVATVTSTSPALVTPPQDVLHYDPSLSSTLCYDYNATPYYYYSLDYDNLLPVSLDPNLQYTFTQPWL